MKTSTRFTCGDCGHVASRWFGRCPACDSWGTATAAAAPGKGTSRSPASLEVSSLARTGPPAARYASGVRELDRVLGGGIVPGSVVLLSGDPGIGKSTLVLQMIDGLMGSRITPLLVSGEESLDQIALRAHRLGNNAASMRAAAATSLPAILQTARAEQAAVLVVDSVQTLQDPAHDSAPGSVVQVRECTAELVRFAKGSGTAVVLVGHVTKEGTVAGPRTLEHLVDAVLSLEGERTGTFRLLRALKNRFGSCDEAGVFTMEADGLTGVEDPSAMFLADRLPGVAGSTVFPALEGARPVLIEIQALVAASKLPQPRRVAIGCDAKRLALLVGVLSQRGLARLVDEDIFVAAAGGLQVREPAADLALCLSLMSSSSMQVVPHRTVAIGEVGLAGEVRRVPGIQRRIAEAERLGFTHAIVPRGMVSKTKSIRLIEVRDVSDALEACISTAAA